MGATFEQIAESGPLLLAVGAAALAGLVSFLSPCVLPLIPGYLSYVTGLAGSELDASAARAGTVPAAPAGPSSGTASVAGQPTGTGLSAERTTGTAPSAGRTAGTALLDRPAGRSRLAVKSRVLAGTLLFIAGFTTVFILTAVLVAGVGNALATYERQLEIGVGVLIIVLGLAFVGLVPGLEREFRIHRLPAAGLLGAPVFGAVFALSWIPCVGPTLSAVLGLAATSGSTDRAVILAIAYCLGLGLPFMVFGLGFERLLGVFRVIRRNSRWVTRLGGALLVAVGLALVTGGWQSFVIWLQTTFGTGQVGI